MVKKVLFITLSNIGDVILTLPVLDSLRQHFPGSEITVMAGPRVKEIFAANPNISRMIVYDKHAPLREKIKLFLMLKKEKFDVVVDLRNTLFGALLPAPIKTLGLKVIPSSIAHMKDRHLYRWYQAIRRLQGPLKESAAGSLWIDKADEEHVSGIFNSHGIKEADKIIVIAPGARSNPKRWGRNNFLGLITTLINEDKAKIILVGDGDDAALTGELAVGFKGRILDLGGKTTLRQLVCVLKKAGLLISNDSATSHLASYYGVPVAAIFGPTNEKKYGPWSGISRVVKKDIFCRPCEQAQCRFGTLECLRLVKVEDVLRQAREMIVTRTPLDCTRGRQGHKVTRPQEGFKRILIVRTDRIGDVLLSTPVIKALRDEFPHAYIAIMVSPYARDIVDGNPYLDEVIICDKEGRHKSWLGYLALSRKLKKKHFEVAFILHPTNRVHLITYLARIPKRAGYNRKLGFLLTDRLPHKKQLGERHELEYNLDVINYLGIDAPDKTAFMPLKPDSEAWVDSLLAAEGITAADKLVGIHPGASCPSKVWPVERFAEVADRLIEKYGFKILVVAGPKDTDKANTLITCMHRPAVNLAAKTSVSQLASLLNRCALFISNDSGPVHIASALGTPVISIFGRNQQGLSPKRWGPRGLNSIILHKEVGCRKCLAHKCVLGFQCLKAISVQDVLDSVNHLMQSERSFNPYGRGK